MQETPSQDQIADALETAAEVVERSRALRKRYRRRRTAKRVEHLKAAAKRCATAAEPLRSYIGMVAWHDLPIDTELTMKNAIGDLRYERRQLDKMSKL